ncbi:MAG: response regulator [Rhodospirillales bacterium]|nr:response regulator [Rhodospirillales bacterium]
MNEQPHILVVDDDREIRDSLAKYLTKNEYRVSIAADARAARKILSAASIDLVVLDIMMPGEDGLSLCQYIRQSSDLPVILLTARDDDMDRIVGLEVGADDYVTKPFNPRELLARIKTVSRRTNALPPRMRPVQEKTVRFADWTLNLSQRELIGADGVAVPLSAAEFQLLSAFLDHPRMVLSRDQLLDITSGREARVFDRAIDNQVSRLRRKVEVDPQIPVLIKTVRGGGYMFTGEVERA